MWPKESKRWGKGRLLAYYYFEAAAPREEGNPLRFSVFEKSEEKGPRSAAARRVAADRRSRRGQGYLSRRLGDNLIPSLLDILRSILNYKNGSSIISHRINKDVSTGLRALVITITVFRSDHHHLLSPPGGSSSPSIQIIVDLRRQLHRFLHFFGRSQSIMGQILATVQDKLHGKSLFLSPLSRRSSSAMLGDDVNANFREAMERETDSEDYRSGVRPHQRRLRLQGCADLRGSLHRRPLRLQVNQTPPPPFSFFFLITSGESLFTLLLSSCCGFSSATSTSTCLDPTMILPPRKSSDL